MGNNADIKKGILVQPSLTVLRNWPVNFREEDLPEFEAQKNYNTYNSYLRQHNNVWVTPDSVVYKNGLLINASLPSGENKSYYRFRYLIKKMLKSKRISLDKNKKYLLATDLWSVGHFHWLVDILPKLKCIEERVSEFILLLPDTKYMREFAAISINKLKLCFESIYFMNLENIFEVSQLFHLSQLGQSGHCIPGLMNAVRDSLVPNAKKNTKRIYISRQNALYRKIINEDALIELLKKYDFEVLVTENLSLEEELEVFSSASTIVSIHGAGLTNCIFMNRGSNVIEIRKKENGPFNVGYWHLSDSLGHNYYYYNGVADSDLSIVGRGCNIEVPLIDFENNILKSANVFS